LEAQLFEQLQSLDITNAVYELLRKAMRDAHDQEKEFRDNAITALRRRQDEIQSKQDALLQRLLDKTIPSEV
jgi:ElaB/YqjD/DUF883 family membrane-anchored ribosome-binding protein